MAASHFIDAEWDLTPLKSFVPPSSLNPGRTIIERRFNTPPTSSIGRLFDAVAALLGLRTSVSHEGQAAIKVEWLAERASAGGSYLVEISQEASPNGTAPAFVVDTRPVVRAILWGS